MSRPPWAKELLDWLKTFAIALVIVFLLHTFVFNLSTVKGQSMEPTLQDAEWLFVNKVVYLLGSPERGDVVIVEDPEHELKKSEFLVKRVIAVPGDRIEIRGKRLYLNGEQLVEPYTDLDIEDNDYGPLTVEPGSYFIMGDNRHAGASRDSRAFGTVAEGMIKGRADFILWPITDMKRL
ncbi:signal peptidase I [Paenibacillus sp. SYP-B4298]|uniref:signal peptidase I n=1 Tax=Paenibacillus sp. SYP-B4298 TaxID=2996034 RepID=UPI0022DDB9E4|nr:signal peptidase I [Paenibacillus sp. SYP-B4298]